MSRAEKYIQEHTKVCSNEIEWDEGGLTCHDYASWLTTDQARKAVEIAREEIYEWLKEHSQKYVYWMDEEFGKDDLINDLKQAMKDE